MAGKGKGKDGKGKDGKGAGHYTGCLKGKPLLTSRRKASPRTAKARAKIKETAKALQIASLGEVSSFSVLCSFKGLLLISGKKGKATWRTKRPRLDVRSLGGGLGLSLRMEPWPASQPFEPSLCVNVSWTDHRPVRRDRPKALTKERNS